VEATATDSQILAGSVEAWSDRSSGQPWLSSSPAPLEFDGYRLVRPIGRGAMGEVFLAKDTVLDRDVAIKFVSVVRSGSRARDRFLREARAIARLQHPNVVAIYRAGEVVGIPYLVSELVRGRSLDRVRGRVESAELIRMAIGLTAGLAAAHRGGVLHRDLKPANALLSEDGEVKLCDFGLAKLVDAAAESYDEPMKGIAAAPASEEVALTRTGALMGTPRYMAPELWRLEPATVHTDLWALGAMLYQLAAGRPPYPSALLAELHEAVLAGKPPKLVSVAPDVDPGIAAIIDRCLDPLPERRPASADELHAALLALAAPSGKTERMPARRRRTLLLGSAVAAIVAVSLALWLPDRERSTAAPAVAAQVAARARSEFFVDASARNVATGDASAPYTSITAALAAANRSTAASKTIHVAAGTYDSARETFPLELRDGISLQGEGAKATSIVGVGRIEHVEGGTVARKPLLVTILVGGPLASQSIRGITIRPGPGSAEGHPWGIFCDRGNAFKYPPPPVESPTPAPNLVLDQLDITEFDHSIVIGTSDRPAPSGCNARITRSLIAGKNSGLFVVGSGHEGSSNTPNRASAVIGGDSPEDGNLFIGSRDLDGTGSSSIHKARAVQIFDNSTPVVIRHNTFSDDDVGVSISNHTHDAFLVVDDNSFTRISMTAVKLLGNPNLRSLSNNVFSGVNALPDDKMTTCGASLTRATAVCIQGFGENVIGPQIGRARGNMFVGNDIGVYVTGTGFSDRVARQFDFGTEADPGNNTFVCNSAVGALSGYDVWLDTGTSSGTVAFAGNGWDYPGQLRVSARAPNGTDIVVRPRGPKVDVQGAFHHKYPCPGPHHP